MGFRFYSKFLEDLLTVGLKGRSSLAGTLSATPTLWAKGVTSAYTFDAAHDEAADLSGVTTVVASWDGEDATQVRFDNGILWVSDGGPGELVASGTAVAGVALYVDHGTWTRLIGFYDNFEGKPFSVDDGDSPEFRWSGFSSALFDFFACSVATAGLYPRFVEECLAALIGGTARTSLPASATIKIDLLTEQASYSWAHRFLSHIPDVWWARTDAGAAQTLGSIVVSSSGVEPPYAMVDAADSTFTSATGADVLSMVAWIDTGDPATSILALFGLVEYAGSSHSVLALNGTNLVLAWAAASPQFFRLEAA